MNEQWITDRLPTEEDSLGGYVAASTKDEWGWHTKQRVNIKPGEPWAHIPTIPPYQEKKTPEQIARETVPDGYVFDGRDGTDRLLPKGSLFYSANRGWSPNIEDKHGVDIYRGIFCAIPKKQYWSKPSDIPADARFFRASHYDNCQPIGQIAQYGVILNRLYEWDGLDMLRWSDRPFDRFEDGKECLVEGGADE